MMTDYQKYSDTQLVKALKRVQAEQSVPEGAQVEHYLRHDLEVHQIELEMQNRELRDKQKELEAARDKYADLYDFAPVSYLTLDHQGIILEANLTASTLLHQPRGQLIKKPFSALLTNGDSMVFFSALRRVLATGEEHSVELTLEHRDKTQTDVLVQMLPFVTGTETQVRTCLVDIGLQKQAERELQHARELAEESNKVKSKLLTRISHEQRTPLNAILGFAQLLSMNEDNTLSPKDMECVQQILSAGYHLLDVVNELLDLEAAAAHKLELHNEAVDPLPLVEDCLKIMQPLAQQQGINIEHTMSTRCSGVCLKADPMRLRQVLINLLSNAVKYNHKGGHVSVACEPINEHAARLRVIDTGIGIAEADMASLFEPFNRLYLENNDIEGTGIGLTITQQLVEHMGGKIGAESSVGKGSTFWVELPLCPRP